MQAYVLHFIALVIMSVIGTTSGAFAQNGQSSEVGGSTGDYATRRHQEQEGLGERMADDYGAPRLLNLGSHTFPVSTGNQLAQQYMNQGLNLSYAFNHAEAGRAFREAARLDPALAMAYWGQALVLGPNINAPMEAKNEALALELVRRAASLGSGASDRERALIGALEKRYTGNPEDRKANDKAYANAMREVHRRFRGDQDIAMLFVESLMDTSPWGYWMRDDYPLEGTKEIVAVTENVLQGNPRHPGATHMYIHLMEPTNMPERAERAADTLLTLMPDAGHLIHMPSHIYLRVGRYEDAINANQRAIAADERYLVRQHEHGFYAMAYFPHNIHFLWAAATADGQSELAIESARKVASTIDDAVLKEMPMTGIFRVVPYWALTRFGKWDEMLQEPEPPSSNAFLKGGWHYARGLAFVAKRQLPQAEQELAALRGIMKDDSLNGRLLSVNTARSVLSIGPAVLAGEIAAARGQFDSAIAYLEQAVRLEDSLAYTEPPEWQAPPRLTLGALLLESGHPAEAETVYWEDLRRNRNNGWALYGLLQALRAQGKNERVALVEERFNKAWARADVKLSASRFGCVFSPMTMAGQ